MKNVIRGGLLALVLLTFGCNAKTAATPENYIATLNAYFADHPDCLLADVQFPYETSSPVERKQMDALAVAQMVEGHEELAIHVSRYTLTEAGKRVGPHFCFGHRQITSILSNTPVAVENGFQETHIIYQYAMADVPVWAKTPEVVAAFPKITAATSGQARARSTLALTGVGWSVPE